jgi:hypothetical protein
MRVALRTGRKGGKNLAQTQRNAPGGPTAKSKKVLTEGSKGNKDGGSFSPWKADQAEERPVSDIAERVLTKKSSPGNVLQWVETCYLCVLLVQTLFLLFRDSESYLSPEGKDPDDCHSGSNDSFTEPIAHRLIQAAAPVFMNSFVPFGPVSLSQSGPPSRSNRKLISKKGQHIRS